MKIYKKRWGRVALMVLFLGVLGLGLTSAGLTGTVQAAEIRQGDHVVIGADEVIDDDLFVSGQTIQVDGTVNGDLFAAGNEVTINGDVAGSLFIAGQTLQINGDIDGSVYGSSYSLTVGREATIGRNLYYSGFSLETNNGSAVGRGLYAGGYQVIINGEVSGDVNSGSGALEINGTVGGDVVAEVSEAGGAPPFMPNFSGSVPMVATGYRLGQNAQIGGREDIEITGGIRVDVGESVAGYAWRVLQGRLGEFIALLIIGGLLLWLWPGMVHATSTAAQKKPLPSAGWGCLITLVFPLLLVVAIMVLVIVAILLGLITFGQLTGDVVSIGAVSIAWIVVVFNFILFTLSKVIVAFMVGRLILTRLVPGMKPVWLNVLALLLGALIYELLRIIPILGWVVALITIFVGLGAMFIARQRPQPGAPTSPPPPPVPEITPPPHTPAPPHFEESEPIEEAEILAEPGMEERSDVAGGPILPEELHKSNEPEEPDDKEKPDATV